MPELKALCPVCGDHGTLYTVLVLAPPNYRHFADVAQLDFPCGHVRVMPADFPPELDDSDRAAGERNGWADAASSGSDTADAASGGHPNLAPALPRWAYAEAGVLVGGRAVVRLLLDGRGVQVAWVDDDAGVELVWRDTYTRALPCEEGGGVVACDNIGAEVGGCE